MLSNADSAREQIKEIPMATTTKSISSNTLIAVGSATASAANAGYGNRVDSKTINAKNIEADGRMETMPRLEWSRAVGGGLADASLQARGRHKRGTNIKVVNKLGNLNRKK